MILQPVFTRRTRALASFGALAICALVASPASAVGIQQLLGATDGGAIGASLPLASQPTIFTEIVGGTIGAGGLAVDHDGTAVVARPTVSGGVVNPALRSSTLSAGTVYDSYFFHFASASGGSGDYIVTFELPDPIVGVQLFGAGSTLEWPAGTAYIGTLEAGDIQVVSNGSPTSYPTGVAGRGIEGDDFVLAINGNKVMLAGSVVGGDIDQVRFFTSSGAFSPSPEPASLAVWSLAAVAVAAGLGRRSLRV